MNIPIKIIASQLNHEHQRHFLAFEKLIQPRENNIERWEGGPPQKHEPEPGFRSYECLKNTLGLK